MAFREVVGHRRLVSLLAQAIRASVADAEPHSCRARRCRQTPDGDVDRAGAELSDAERRQRVRRLCAVCRRIARGTHPDVMTIEPGDSGSIKIEQVRAAIDRAVFRPFEGRRRVTIIEQADALVIAAQNALLKTLEEPLPASVFVLVTSRPDTLLPTVRSRCAHLRFGRLQVAEVADGARAESGLFARGCAGGGRGVRRQRPARPRSRGRCVCRGPQRCGGSAAGCRPRSADAPGAGQRVAEGRRHARVRARASRRAAAWRCPRWCATPGLLASGADARLLANLDRRAARRCRWRARSARSGRSHVHRGGARRGRARRAT